MTKSADVDTAAKLRESLSKPPTKEDPLDMKTLLLILRNLTDPFIVKHTATLVLENFRDHPHWFEGKAGVEFVAEARKLAYAPDENGFISFGEMSRLELRQQCQYGSRYVYGDGASYPNLGRGLRFENYEMGRNDWHSLRIHVGDVAEFLLRYHAHRE